MNIPSAAKTRTKAAKILVIDDESEITQIVEAFLSNAGYEVATENSSVMGIELAKQFRPDLILLDIMMPNMDGYEICDELKKSKETATVPVIFLTGKDSRDDKGRSFQVGGDMFVKKPFSCERLLEIITIVLASMSR
jgi:DNA-binding response OmpR family regulator